MTVVATLSLDGGDRVAAALARVGERAAEATLVAAGRAGAFVVEGEWKRSFRRKSEPSVAGLPPRVQTGTYRRAVHTEIESSSRHGVVLRVGPSITQPPYPAYLEYGTSRMPAHPIARPAWDRSKDRARSEMTRILTARLGL